jgi:hypothetical protein
LQPAINKAMNDYREMARTIINRLGGDEVVKRMIIKDRQGFWDNILPDTISKYYSILGDRKAIYDYVKLLLNG